MKPIRRAPQPGALLPDAPEPLHTRAARWPPEPPAHGVLSEYRGDPRIMKKLLAVLVLVLAAPRVWAECDFWCEQARNQERRFDRRQRELDARLDREERYREHLDREYRKRSESKP
jgi:hypothetical protein